MHCFLLVYDIIRLLPHATNGCVLAMKQFHCLQTSPEPAISCIIQPINLSILYNSSPLYHHWHEHNIHQASFLSDFVAEQKTQQPQYGYSLCYDCLIGVDGQVALKGLCVTQLILSAHAPIIAPSLTFHCVSQSLSYNTPVISSQSLLHVSIPCFYSLTENPKH